MNNLSYICNYRQALRVPFHMYVCMFALSLRLRICLHNDTVCSNLDSCSVKRSFEENGSFNPGKEIKAETQTYYQALIDNRDSPFIVSKEMTSKILNSNRRENGTYCS